MLQLMSPAGSPEAVIAAVQSGADIVYIGAGLTESTAIEPGFAPEQLVKCLRYCRLRGCRTAYALPGPATDGNLERLCRQAVFAAENGADALLVSDWGLVRCLRSLLPETELWGDVSLGFSDLGSVLSGAALGLKRVVLAPELGLDSIRAICAKAPIETVVYAHGHLCFSRAGQCHIGAFAGMEDGCGDLCRERFDLGGRMDDRPMSMRDICLLDHISPLADAGVSCLAIEGHDRSAEYISFTTELYFRAIREHVPPTAEERRELENYFSPTGITDGYLTGDESMAASGAAYTAGRDERRAKNEIRRRYMSGELRRIPLKFAAIIEPGKPAVFAAEDALGHRAVVEGYEPVDLGRPGIGENRVRDILYRTGGTPYTCVDIRCSVDKRMDYPDEAVEQARRELVAQISAMSREPKALVRGEMPSPPEIKTVPGDPKMLCQVSRTEQLTEELACTDPDGLYVPIEWIAGDEPGLEHFRRRNIPLMAVLPPVADEKETETMERMAAAAKDRGVDTLLGGSFGYLPLARKYDMNLRGDYGLNVLNSHALQALAEAKLCSATVSFRLSMDAIEAMAKPLDTEMIVYGRVPVMVADRCILRPSAGRCNCEKPVMMYGRRGEQYPVLKGYGCRNIVFSPERIFLADRAERYLGAGLSAVRLLFSSESARECVDVMRRYKYHGDYTPNNISRGLYGKGNK